MSPLELEFDAAAAAQPGVTHVPVVARLICDDLTPVGAFARLEAGAARAFLLESVVGGERVARYSFLGAEPARTFALRGPAGRIVDHATAATRDAVAADPLAVLQQELATFRVAAAPHLPRFIGGAVGYAAYDAVRYYEHLPRPPADDRRLPDLLFDIYDALVIFDHVRKIVLLVALADLTTHPAAQAYANAAARLECLRQKLAAPLPLQPTPLPPQLPPAKAHASNFDCAAFERAVAGCQEYIRAGDIFQVVLSQRLRVETPARPLDIYRALRVINPSPFMFYLKTPEVVLVGASPEILCRVEDGRVTNRPLAGTRPRGATDAEDRRLAAELLADPKERAEHIMLVDLGRNDVGRVCRPASIRVSEVMAVEYYSHVMHLSSNVTGELADGLTAFDALRAALPVGTVSGAPKVRAMQIIDEFEPTRRGPYAGGVGYVDFAGNMDTCIALRTLVIRPAAAGPGDRRYTVDVQVGAGIVADSIPQREFEETLNKARGQLVAIHLAEQAFGDTA